MKNSSFQIFRSVALALGLVFGLFFAGQARANYIDGANLYGGYFAERAGMDPSGRENVPACTTSIYFGHTTEAIRDAIIRNPRPVLCDGNWLSYHAFVSCNADIVNRPVQENHGGPYVDGYEWERSQPRDGLIPEFPVINTPIGPGAEGGNAAFLRLWRDAMASAERATSSMCGRSERCPCKEVAVRIYVLGADAREWGNRRGENGGADFFNNNPMGNGWTQGSHEERGGGRTLTYTKKCN